MPFQLGTHNVFNYLERHRLCYEEEQELNHVELKVCKNFNLLVNLSHDRQLLVKQEVNTADGEVNGDLFQEWRFYQLIKDLKLTTIQSLISDAIHFDHENAILVFNYLQAYCDLDSFYTEQQVFPTDLATVLGRTLAEVHRASIDHPGILAVLATNDNDGVEPDLKCGLGQITPEIFGNIATDGLKFYELYQRHASLEQAIDRLNETYEPCCLTHHDLKFNNILLHHDWSTHLHVSNYALPNGADFSQDAVIRLIDWEKWAWGDPGFDLGTLLADYLKIWLKSLWLSPDIEIEVALRLAGTPLEQLQPSMVALVQSYLHHFPQILEHFPDFLTRTLQFAGLALIESLQARIHYYEPFGNVGICMLQVAKVLLCSPEESAEIVFGVAASALTDLSDRPLSSSQQPTPQHQSQRHQRQRPDIIPSKPDTAASDLLTTFASTRGDAMSADMPGIMLQEDVLRDIVHHIHIQENGEIYHSHYKPLELLDNVVNRFQKLSPALKQGFLRTQLRNYLYDVYYSGEQELAYTQIKILEIQKNSTVRGIDKEFYDTLQRVNHGTGYFDPGWLVVKRDRSQSLIVKKQGLTLQIEPDRHLQRSDRAAVAGEFVAVHLPAYRIENGFYVAISNMGSVNNNLASIEICFNVDSEAALAILQELTEHLNAMVIPFTVKLLLDPLSYKRYDAVVLQIERIAYAATYPILRQVYRQQQSHFRSTTPLFTKRLAPGLGLAEEPEDTQDFGLDRCEWIAAGLLSAWEQGHHSPAARLESIHQLFAQRQINLQYPYLNPNSQDIYTSIDCLR